MTTKSNQLGSIVKRSLSQASPLLKNRLKKRTSSRNKLSRIKGRKVFTLAATTKVKVMRVSTHQKSSSLAMVSSKNRPLRSASQAGPMSTWPSLTNNQLKRCHQKSTQTALKSPTLRCLIHPLMMRWNITLNQRSKDQSNLSRKQRNTLRVAVWTSALAKKPKTKKTSLTRHLGKSSSANSILRPKTHQKSEIRLSTLCMAIRALNGYVTHHSEGRPRLANTWRSQTSWMMSKKFTRPSRPQIHRISRYRPNIKRLIWKMRVKEPLRRPK